MHALKLAAELLSRSLACVAGGFKGLGLMVREIMARVAKSEENYGGGGGGNEKNAQKYAQQRKIIRRGEN